MPFSSPAKTDRRRPLSFRARHAILTAMELAHEITCPYCFETITVTIDTSGGDCELVVDCEVCCRPIRLEVECKPGEIESVNAEAE
jgi:hypothetical protein